MFLSQPHYIGAETGKSSVRIAKMRKTRKGWEVALLKEISSSERVNPLYKQLKECVLVTALQTRDVLVRTCEMPLKKTKDILAALSFHVEPLLPYPADKAVICAQITGHQENATALTVFAVRKDHLSTHLDGLKTYQLEPDVVTSKAHACAAFSTLLPQTNSPMLLVHEGEEEITTVLVEKGLVLAARAFDTKKNGAVEIQKTLLSFSSSHKNKNYEAVYFLGKDPQLKHALEEASGKTVLPLFSELGLTQEEGIHYGLAIGCALSHAVSNFRQKEYSCPNPFRRLKKPLATFFLLALLFAGSICVFGEAMVRHKKHDSAQSYSALCQSENKMAPMMSLQTPLEYLISLQALEKEMRARPDTFPLLPQAPKVKEVLGWLMSLPEGQSVGIESLHYQMVKHPDFSQKQERYKVRIELEISASTPNAARSFQEALKNSQLWVDTNEEMQWLPVKGKYKVSFYLKDKTQYL